MTVSSRQSSNDRIPKDSIGLRILSTLSFWIFWQLPKHLRSWAKLSWTFMDLQLRRIHIVGPGIGESTTTLARKEFKVIWKTSEILTSLYPIRQSHRKIADLGSLAVVGAQGVLGWCNRLSLDIHLSQGSSAVIGMWDLEACATRLFFWLLFYTYWRWSVYRSPRGPGEVP